MDETLTLRIAARYAREVSAGMVSAGTFTEQEWKTYKKKHPGADPKHHTITKGDKGEGEGGGGKEEKGGLLSRLKGKLSKISDAAKKVLTDAPKKAQQFMTDSSYRKEALKSTRDAMKAAPSKYAKNLLKTVKHEAHEWKETASGIAAVMKGGKMTPEQKKAAKTVATHMAITAAAAALSTAGLAAGAAFMGKAMAKHVAMKAAAEVLGDMHVLGELGHVGHGLMEILKFGADESDVDPQEAFAALVIVKVLDEIDKLGDDDMAAILEEIAKGKGGEEKTASQVAQRFVLAASADELLPLLDEITKFHERTIQPWIKQFPQVLARAERDAAGLEDGWVWQDEFVRYLGQYDDRITPTLQDLDEKLEDIWMSTDYLNDIVNIVQMATHEPTGKGRIAHAISDINFVRPEGAPHDRITYRVDTLKEWAKAFEKWTKDSVADIKTERRKAQQRIKRRQG